MVHKALKPYDHMGVQFNSPSADDKDASGTCPFCEHHRRKFNVNLDTGQYRCLHCNAKGNTYSFLDEYYNLCLSNTTTDDYKELAEDRLGLPWTFLRDAGITYDTYAGQTRWLIPVRNQKKSIINLRTYIPGKYVGAVAGLPLSLWLLENLPGRGPIYLCEGEWDALALQRLLKKAKKKGVVLATPGCQIFKDDWKGLFTNRDVVICYDNDNSGEEGAEMVARKLQATASSIRILRWPPEVEDKWDIRDMVRQALDVDKTEAKDVWTAFTRLLQIPAYLASTSPSENGELAEENLPKRTSFNTVAKDFRDRYHLTKGMIDGLALMYATVISIQLPGDPVWLFVVGPAGAGKTMLLDAYRKADRCIFKSSLTPKSLISGYIDSNSFDRDPSLIPKLKGQVLILKDYTEIITMNKDAQEEMYGILRGAFDGHAEKTFGNGLTRSYPDCHFAMLSGVTDVIHGDSRAELGERFLKYQLQDGIQHDPAKQIESAITGMADQVENAEYLQRVSKAFLLSREVEKNNLKVPQPERWLVERMIALTQIVAHLRASVPRIGKDEIAYRPAPEVGTRLAKQLIKLGQCLAIVYGKSKIDKECWKLMFQVALDTAKGWNLDIFLELAKVYPKTMLAEGIMEKANISRTTTKRRLDNMKLLGTIEFISEHQGTAGRPPHGFKLTDPIAALWKKVTKP